MTEKRYSVAGMTSVNVIVKAKDEADAIRRAQAGEGELDNHYCGDAVVSDDASVVEYTGYRRG